MKSIIKKIKKRDGRIMPFKPSKIERAIWQAAKAAGGKDRKRAKELTRLALGELEKRFNDTLIPEVEQVQDVVEKILLQKGHEKTYKAYTLYRDLHGKLRDITSLVDTDELIEKYLTKEDWRVKDNANMTYSLQGLNNHVASIVSSNFWLNKIYPREVRKAHRKGDLHIHNLTLLSAYCCGWDLKDLLIRGFGGVPGKVWSSPAKHFSTALGQLVNFFYTLQGEIAGAVAIANFDTYLAPFIAHDSLSYKEVKQAMQEFIYNMNVPTRTGFQSLSWDELVVIKERGKIKMIEIGSLVDDYFGKNRQRILEENPGSFAVENTDNIQALSFNKNGQAVWSKVKAFIRHKVPKGSKFIKIKTSRGSASVSPAHSLFKFKKLNNKFRVEPVSAQKMKLNHFNQKLTEDNHLVALYSCNFGEKNIEKLDLLSLIEEYPYLWKKIFVNLDKKERIEQIKEKIKAEYGGMTPFYIKFGFYDRNVWQDWQNKGIVRFDVFTRFAQMDWAKGFYLKNSKLVFTRFLEGEKLEAFVKICAWYLADGHCEISNQFYISQTDKNKKEIINLLKNLNILGRIEESRGFSSKGNKVEKVYKISGNGLLASLIIASCGSYASRKEIPWFVFELSKTYKEGFIKALLKGDGSEYKNYFDYTTTSKKISLGLSFFLTTMGKEFSVYEEERREENWNDQYILRIYKNKRGKDEYRVGDFCARICFKKEYFSYKKEFEYDLSVEQPTENFIGGSGLLVFHNTPFTNVTLDLKPSGIVAEEAVIIGGKPTKSCYKDFQKEIDWFNKAFAEVMSEGDAQGRVFTFPIPTYSITKDFDWDNGNLKPVWEMTRKYGVPYFANFVNSDMKPSDIRSMCCRLKLDNRVLRKRGGLFAANPLTGSLGVVTVNLPRIGFLSKSKREFLSRLGQIMDLAKESLMIKRRTVEEFTAQGLYPYCRYYLSDVKARTGKYWRNHFNTIGILGMNEALLNSMRKSITTSEGKAFALEAMDFARKKLIEYQRQTGELFNLEATPGETTAYTFALLDKKQFPKIICANEQDYKKGTAPFYTNSTFLPVDYTDDIFQALDHQDSLQCKYTGGTVFHGFLGESLPDGQSVKNLVEKIAQNYRLPYFTLTPTFSVCPKHGYLKGEWEYCPKCDKEIGWRENQK